MPTVNWGQGVRQAVADFDREAQYKPYTGPVPTNGAYRWNLKVLKFVAGGREKFPQLRMGWELVPRTQAEKKYAGYFLIDFAPVGSKTAFRYVPFLDLIGVNESEFENRTVTDAEGNIRKIGRWRNDGSLHAIAILADDVDEKGNPRKKVGPYYGPDEGSDLSDDDDFDDEDTLDEDDEDEFVEEDEEPEPPRRKRTTATRSRTTRARRANRADDDF